MPTDVAELTWTSTLLLMALSGVIGNIAWEVLNYFGHAALHSFASAWHEIKKMPVHLFSISAPLRIAAVVFGMLALFSLGETMIGVGLSGTLNDVVAQYRANFYALADVALRPLMDPATRYIAYDTLFVTLLLSLVLIRAAAGWHLYGEFRSTHREAGSLSLATYLAIHVLGAVVAVAFVFAMISRIV
jgi:hypothetical protein